MALTVESLKGLYEKLGGEDFGDVNTIPEAIDKVAEVAEGGGGGGGADLPEPGTAGNVLTSTGDGWESAAPSGNDFDVTAELSTNGSTFEILNPTPSFAETLAAFEAGKNVKITATNESLGVTLVGQGNLAAEGGAITFITSFYNDLMGGDRVCVIHYFQNDTAGIYFLPDIPDVGPYDNDKALGVVEGNYTLVDSKAPLIIHGTAAIGTPSTVTITTALADIYAAADADRAVFLEYAITDAETGEIDTTRMSLVQRVKSPTQADPSVFEFEIVFGAPYITGGAPAIGSVRFENALVGELTTAVAQ